MGLKKFKPNLQGADLEKIKAVCYPCTSQNDCSRRLNNDQATVEKCNSAYEIFGISPPPADYSAPGRQGGLGTALFAIFLPMSSYSSSCILSLCSIYFVVSAASKR